MYENRFIRFHTPLSFYACLVDGIKENNTYILKCPTLGINKIRHFLVSKSHNISNANPITLILLKSNKINTRTTTAITKYILEQQQQQ